MSDLAATNCNNGCGCNDSGNGCSSIIWIILLLSCCGNGNSIFGGNGCGDDDGCSGIVLILLICCLCGGNSWGF